MCLHRPESFKVRKEDGYNVGYKLFYYQNKKFYNTYQSITKSRRTDEWLKAYRTKQGWISYWVSTYGGYSPGFHIFKHLDSALRHMWFGSSIVVKVYADEITATGTETGDQIFVSKYMFIPSDGLKWLSNKPGRPIIMRP